MKTREVLLRATAGGALLALMIGACLLLGIAVAVLTGQATVSMRWLP